MHLHLWTSYLEPSCTDPFRRYPIEVGIANNANQRATIVGVLPEVRPAVPVDVRPAQSNCHRSTQCADRQHREQAEHGQATSVLPDQPRRLGCTKFLLWVCVVTGASNAIEVTAQIPEQPQSVQLPGQDTTLRAGWMLVATPDGRCQYKVPQSWRVATDNSLAWSMDGALSVGVSTASIGSWTMHKANLKDAIHPPKVHEDTDKRLWCESPQGPARRVHYISVFAGTVACDAQIEERTNGAPSISEVVKEIAAGLSVSRRN